MSQDFTDNVYDSSFNVFTVMENIEKNFNALKTTFIGPSAPPNSVTTQFWADTTTHILKIKNEANSAWISIWDLASGKPILSSLSGDITGAMIAAAIKDAAAGTPSLRTLGTGANQACAGNDYRLGLIPDGSISQAKLKSTSGSASCEVDFPNSIFTNWTGALPGGSYAFRLKYYSTVTDTFFVGYYGIPATSYASPSAKFTAYGGTTTGAPNCFAQEQYVQSSGEVHWIFSLKNRVTGIIEKSWQAPDHCCFGNGDDPDLFQHPYGDYDQDKYELIVINPPKNFVQELNKKAGKTKDLLEIIGKEYVIDDLSAPTWPTEKVTIGLPERWEEAWQTGQPVKPIKAMIPKPKQAIVRTFKKR